MKFLNRSTHPLLRFAVAVMIAALALIGVNPFMANDRAFGQPPWHYVALALPAVAATVFLHVAVPAEQRSGIVSYALKVVASAAFAYLSAAVLLLLLAFAVTGEFV